MTTPNFPSSPVVGQTYTVGSIVYECVEAGANPRWRSKSNADKGLRTDLAAVGSNVLVGGVAASKLSVSVGHLKQLSSMSLSDNRTYEVISFYDGWAAQSHPTGGGIFVYKASFSKAAHNGITIIDPAKLAAWDGTLANISTLFSTSVSGTGVFCRVAVGGELFATWSGADPYGSNNSHTCLQRLFDVTKAGDKVVVDGYFRCGSTLTANKTITIAGMESRSTNVPNITLTSSTIYFDAGSSVGLQIQGSVVTVSGVILVGTGVGDGIKSSGVNNALILTGGSVVQTFEVGVRLVEGYYNKLDGSTITFCRFPLLVDYCYNVTLSKMTIRAEGLNTQGITLINGSQLTMQGGSIENCEAFGIGIYGQSTASLHGTYFENHGGKNIQLANGGSVATIGCNVYLNTGANVFIGVESESTTGTRVFSRGNKINTTIDSALSVVYSPNASDNQADWDVAGDIWPANAGVNASYVSGTYTGRVGKFNIQFPSNHPSYDKPISTIPWAVVPSNSGYSGTPLDCTMMSWTGSGSGDPSGVGATAWGNNPYMAVYHKGQWEKVGLRLPNQSDSAASSVSGIVSDFNALLSKLRAAGVML